MVRSVVGFDIGYGVLCVVEVVNLVKFWLMLLWYYEMLVLIEVVNWGEVIDFVFVVQVFKVMWLCVKFGIKDVVFGMGNQWVFLCDYSVWVQLFDCICEQLFF